MAVDFLPRHCSLPVYLARVNGVEVFAKVLVVGQKLFPSTVILVFCAWRVALQLIFGVSTGS